MKKEGDNAMQDTMHATAKSAAQVEEYYDNQHNISGKFKLAAKAPMVEAPIYEDDLPF